MTSVPWPWRLFTFEARATRREYWAVMVPSVVYISSFIWWDEGRRPNDEPPDQLSLLGFLFFVLAAAIALFAISRRLGDLDFPPIATKFALLLVIGLGVIVFRLSGSEPVGEAVGAIAAFLMVGLIGFKPGVSGENTRGPDPRA